MAIQTHMKIVEIARFKRECLKLLDEVQASRQTILITKRGKPVSKLSPIRKKRKEKADDIFGFMKGKVKIVGDIVSPLPPADWGNLA
jgi:prevent-host-death family protein